MKITPEDFKELRDMLATVDVIAVCNTGNVLRHSLRRNLWDCLWRIPSERRTPWFDRVYKYANDDHVTTALKKIVIGDKPRSNFCPTCGYSINCPHLTAVTR